MNRKIALAVMIAFLLTIFSKYVQSIGGEWYLLTPKMIIRENITDQEVIITKSIGVRNTGNRSVDVEMRPQGDIENFVLDETTFTLGPSSEKWVNFTAIIRKPGRYFQDVIVSFTPKNETQSIGLASQLIFIINEGVTDDNQSNNNGKSFGYSNLVVLTMLIIIIFVLRYRKRGSDKKWRKKKL